MRVTIYGVLFLAGLLLAGCNKTSAPANQQATVTLKDGSTFAGAVTSNSGSSITLQAASGESRTYPMTEVATVQYAPLPNSATPPATAPPDQTPIPPPAAASQAPPPPPAPVAEFRTIPAGANLAVRNNVPIDSETAADGQTYSGVVVRDVVDTEGRVAIPRGSNATLVVREASGQGKLQGRSEIVVDLGSVEIEGRHYRLDTSEVVEKGKEGLGANSRTAKFVGGGTALGTILGAVAGGGKGAAIGALAGAGAGTATQGLTRGKGVRIPAETLLSFQLEAPVRIREVR